MLCDKFCLRCISFQKKWISYARKDKRAPDAITILFLEERNESNHHHYICICYEYTISPLWLNLSRVGHRTCRKLHDSARNSLLQVYCFVVLIRRGGLTVREFFRTLVFYHVAISPGSPLPNLRTDPSLRVCFWAAARSLNPAGHQHLGKWEAPDLIHEIYIYIYIHIIYVYRYMYYSRRSSLDENSCN